MSRRLNKEGTIFEFPENSEIWWAQLPADEYGKRPKRKANSADEARLRLRELEADRDRGLNLVAKQPTVEEFLRYWLEHIVEADLKERTYLSYRDICEWYIIPQIGTIRLDKLRAAHVRKMVAALKLQPTRNRQDRTLASDTIKNAYHRLRRALQLAVDEKYIATNPAADAKLRFPKTASDEEPIGRAMDAAQAHQVLEAVAEHRLSALYHLELAYGPRMGEMLGAMWADLNWEKRTLQIKSQIQYIKRSKNEKGEMVRATLKTPRSRRTLHLSDEVIAILRKHWENQVNERRLMGSDWKEHGLIFPSSVGTPMHPTNLRDHFGRVLRKAKLEHFRFHDLRHTAGSLMLDAGVQLADVSAILGHSSPAITARIYAHSYEDGQKRAAETMARVLQRGGK